MWGGGGQGLLGGVGFPDKNWELGFEGGEQRAVAQMMAEESHLGAEQVCLCRFHHRREGLLSQSCARTACLSPAWVSFRSPREEDGVSPLVFARGPVPSASRCFIEAA